MFMVLALSIRRITASLVDFTKSSRTPKAIGAQLRHSPASFTASWNVCVVKTTSKDGVLDSPLCSCVTNVSHHFLVCKMESNVWS